MHVVQVTKYFFPHKGGMESQVLGIAEGLVGEHKVSVLTSNAPVTANFELIGGINVYRSRVFFTLFNGPFAPGILVDLFKREYDLIQVHLPDPFNSLFALCASKLRNKPLVVTYHADIVKNKLVHKPFKFIHNFLSYAVLSQAKKIIATSPDYITCSDVLPQFRNKITVVPNFVDTRRFYPRDGRVVRKQLGLEDKKIILFVGRLVPYKGLEYLIDAFRLVKEKRRDVALLIIGGGKPDYMTKLVNQAGNDVFFLTATDEELPYYYSACDVFVLPSVTRQEAFGIVLLEAMACGKPVIGTRVGGVPYVVGESGLTVEPRNTQELYHAIQKILSDSPHFSHYSFTKFLRVKDRFIQNNVTKEIIDLYKKVKEQNNLQKG